MPPSNNSNKDAPAGTLKNKDVPIIAVIGATGAQGRPVIQHLVQDGAYRVRALTRDPTHRRAKNLLSLGPEMVELVQGSAMCEATVSKLFEGADGAFVNLDGFALGEKRETYWGIRIFELAMTAKIKHYVWGSLDYTQYKSNWDLALRTGHYDGKGRVAQFMKSFPSPTPSGTTYSVLTSGPYLDMLNEFLSPIILSDGKRVFASPVGQGHLPMIDLDDLGFYARYMFDHRKEFEGCDLEVSSEHVRWDQLVKTFTKVTGLPAIFIDVPEEVYLSTFDKTTPAGYQDSAKAVQPGEDGPMTFHDNFRGFWRTWRADIITRDYAELDRIHPNRVDLEGWIRRTAYDGTHKLVLKNLEDVKTKPIKFFSMMKTLITNSIKYMRGGLGNVGVDNIHESIMVWLKKEHSDLLQPASS